MDRYVTYGLLRWLNIGRVEVHTLVKQQQQQKTEVTEPDILTEQLQAWSI